MHNVSHQINILLDDSVIEPSSQVKFLGLIMDENLNFQAHINSVCSKASSGLFALWRLSCYCNTDLLLTAYYGLVYPFLSYSVVIWGADSLRVKPIFVLQKKIIRLIFGLANTESCRNAFRDNSILTFPSIYLLETLCYIKRNYSSFWSLFLLSCL